MFCSQILGVSCLLLISHHDVAFFLNERLTSSVMLFLCPTSVHNGAVLLICYLGSHKTFSMVRPSLFVSIIDIFFSSNDNIHKSSSGLCFWTSDPLINRIYKNLSTKGSEAQKQRSHKLLWTLWFDEKFYLVDGLLAVGIDRQTNLLMYQTASI